MTGCPAAIAAAQRYREAEARCPKLAYGLDQRDGKCRRVGGKRVCGSCVHELAPQDMLCGGASWPLNGVKAVSATPQRPERNRLSGGR